MENQQVSVLHSQRMQLRKLRKPLRKSCRRLNSKSAVVHRRIQKLIQCSMRFINNGKIYRIYDSGLIQAADLLNSLKSFSQSQQVTRQTESIVELLKKQTLT